MVDFFSRRNPLSTVLSGFDTSRAARTKRAVFDGRNDQMIPAFVETRLMSDSELVIGTVSMSSGKRSRS